MSKLGDTLEEDMKWREDELAVLKKRIQDEQDQTSVLVGAMLRAIWALLYAHYEGFCLFALTTFLDELRALGVSRGECKEQLMLFSLQHHFTSFRKQNTDKPIAAFCQSGFQQLLNSVIDFERNDKFNEYELRGRSNLWPENLVQIYEDFQFRREVLEPKDKRLYLLVDRRNKIAHGHQWEVQDIAEYRQFEDHVIDVMHELAVRVIESVELRQYMTDPARHEQTARFAYKIWDQQGHQPGRDLDFWLEAERRLANGERL